MDEHVCIIKSQVVHQVCDLGSEKTLLDLLIPSSCDLQFKKLN